LVLWNGSKPCWPSGHEFESHNPHLSDKN